MGDHAREHICTYDKKIGRQGISLSDASVRLELRGRVAINKNRKGYRSDTSHDCINQVRGKSHSSESVL
jgi:hypothetical protein